MDMTTRIVQDVLLNENSFELGTRSEGYISTTRLLSVIKSSSEEDVAFDLSNLHHLRSNPYSSMENMRIDSVNLLIRDIETLDTSKGYWLIDTTPSDQGRDLAGLVSLAKSVHSNCKLFFCTSPHVSSQEKLSIDLNHLADGDSPFLTLQQKVSNEMKAELLVGIPAPTQTSKTPVTAQVVTTPKYCKAIGISCNIGKPWCCLFESVSSLTPLDRFLLKSCARTQALLRESSDDSTTPPIFVYMPLFCEPMLYADVLQLLQESHAIMSRVVLCQVNIEFESVPIILNLLHRFPSLLCFDTFGYNDAFRCNGSGGLCSKSKIASNFTLLSIINGLIREGFSDRILASTQIFTKLQWTSGGGQGYRIFNEINQQLCIDDFTLGDLCSTNYFRILTWRKPLTTKPIEVDKLTCHICAEQFIPGNHYSKFSFEYCTKKCLLAHRERDWK
jgi:predicted metal-dependent phosphotriesterase family hydrolase